MTDEEIKQAALDFAGPKNKTNSSIHMVSKISFEAGVYWNKRLTRESIEKIIETIKSKSDYVPDWDQRAVSTKDLETELEKLLNL